MQSNAQALGCVHKVFFLRLPTDIDPGYLPTKLLLKGVQPDILCRVNCQCRGQVRTEVGVFAPPARARLI